MRTDQPQHNQHPFFFHCSDHHPAPGPGRDPDKTNIFTNINNYKQIQTKNNKKLNRQIYKRWKTKQSVRQGVFPAN